MSAYRRMKGTSRSITFQHPNLSAYQHHHHHHLNGVENIKATGFKNGMNNVSDYGNDLWNNNGNDIHNSQDNHQQSMPTNVGSEASYPSQPKHLRFPDVPYSSELFNEFIIFAYTIIAAAMQFLHLYRTVW